MSGDVEVAMEDARNIRWNADQFLLWAVEQTDRWELVRGTPIKMMGGARMGHNRAVRNIMRSLGSQLANGPCEEFAADMAVRTAVDQIRYPDVVVNCGGGDDRDLEAANPVMVAEVFSDSTQPFDARDKLEEYQGLTTLRYILLVETRRRAVELYQRDAAVGMAWNSTRFEKEGWIELPEIQVSLTLDDIYANMDPSPRMTIVRP